MNLAPLRVLTCGFVLGQIHSSCILCAPGTFLDAPCYRCVSSNEIGTAGPWPKSSAFVHGGLLSSWPPAPAKPYLGQGDTLPEGSIYSRSSSIARLVLGGSMLQGCAPTTRRGEFPLSAGLELCSSALVIPTRREVAEAVDCRVQSILVLREGACAEWRIASALLHSRLGCGRSCSVQHGARSQGAL